MTNTKKTKEKGICDCESQAPPKSTLIHPDSPSTLTADTSLDTTLQSQARFFSTLCPHQAGSAPRSTQFVLCRMIAFPLVCTELNHKQSIPVGNERESAQAEKNAEKWGWIETAGESTECLHSAKSQRECLDPVPR